MRHKSLTSHLLPKKGQLNTSSVQGLKMLLNERPCGTFLFCLVTFKYQTFWYQKSDEAAENAQKLNDQAGNVVIVCIACTTMLLIEYDGPSLYEVTSLMDSDHKSHS